MLVLLIYGNFHGATFVHRLMDQVADIFASLYREICIDTSVVALMIVGESGEVLLWDCLPYRFKFPILPGARIGKSEARESHVKLR